MYEFVCKEDNVLKRMSVPVDEIESIEKKIDKGKTYLDIMREKEVNSVKKENKAKEFCVKIKTALNESLNNYLQVLSEELIDDMNGMLFDDMLYMISIRANGSLANKSLEKILQDQESYNLLWKRVDKIKSEVEKI